MLAPYPSAMPTFTPPAREGTRDMSHPLWRRHPGVPIGMNVWRDSSGEWHEGPISQDDIADASIVYYGGRTHTISEAEATALTAAGYEVDA